MIFREGNNFANFTRAKEEEEESEIFFVSFFSFFFFPHNWLDQFSCIIRRENTHSFPRKFNSAHFYAI